MAAQNHGKASGSLRRALGVWVLVLAFVFGGCVVPSTASASSGKETQIYRLYNPYSHAHFYTADKNEVGTMVANGWYYEDVAWVAPSSSSTPVYRLYNRYNGDHLYTTSTSETQALKRQGWRDEGKKFYSASSSELPIHRLYNPYMSGNGGAFSHLWTKNENETSSLKQNGWREEGGGWYGLRNPSSQTSTDANEAFSKIAGSYVMASGKGGWADKLTIHSDGTFEGTQYDHIWKEFMVCNYSGRFGSVLKVDNYTYVTSIASFATQQTPGTSEYIDGVLTTYVGPYGMTPGGTISFYLKGKSASSIPSPFKTWMTVKKWKGTSSLPFRGVYNNLDPGYGFAET